MSTNAAPFGAVTRMVTRTITSATRHGHLPSLLLVDDDEAHRSALASALQSRHYHVTATHDYLTALAAAEENPPDSVVAALKFPGGLGLCFIAKVLARNANTMVVALADYASIATATEALKLGANYFLPKPANAEDVIAALRRGSPGTSAAVEPTVPQKPLSLRKLQWEHILRVLTQNNGNVSATARELGIYRRTLQRKLGKNPPRI